MRNREFRKIGTKVILGKRVTIKEGVNIRFFKIGSCNIQALSVDEAVEKCIACKIKSEAK